MVPVPTATNPINTSCSICHDDFIIGNDEKSKDELTFFNNKTAVALSCGHYYHSSCMKQLLSNGYRECSICKKEINQRNISRFNEVNKTNFPVSDSPKHLSESEAQDLNAINVTPSLRFNAPDRLDRATNDLFIAMQEMQDINSHWYSLDPAIA